MILDFKKISIRGRLAFALINFNVFIDKLEPMFFSNINLKLIIDCLWDVCSQRNIEAIESRVNELAPYSILDNHPKNDFNDYEFLSYDEALALKENYLNMSDDVIKVINLLTEIAFGNMYGSTGEFSEVTYNALKEILDIYMKHNINVIYNEVIENSTFEESNGWGVTYSIKEWRK